MDLFEPVETCVLVYMDVFGSIQLHTDIFECIWLSGVFSVCFYEVFPSLAVDV